MADVLVYLYDCVCDTTYIFIILQLNQWAVPRFPTLSQYTLYRSIGILGIADIDRNFIYIYISYNNQYITDSDTSYVVQIFPP